MKKENNPNAAVSGVSRARARPLTGPKKPRFKPDQKRKQWKTGHNPTSRVVNSKPVALLKPRRTSGRAVPLFQRPFRRAECLVGDDTDTIPVTADCLVTRFIQPIISLDRPVKIPVAYIAKYLKKELWTNALLQGREGKHWRVKIEAGRSFGEGWEQFARDHDLDVGYFLIFCHKGDMLFEVTVIDRTFCKREYPPFDTKDTIKEAEEPSPQPQEVDDSTSSGEMSSGSNKNEQDYPSFTKDLGSSYVSGNALNFPTFFASTNQLCERLNAEVIFHDPSGREFRGLKFSYKGRNNQLFITNGWNNYSRTQRLKEGASVMFMLIRNTKKIVEFQLYHDQSNGSKSKVCAERLKQIKLRHRNFIFTLKKSSIRNGLKIPKSFANRNGLTHKGGKMVIEDGGGRSWEVWLTDDTRPTSLGRGWLNVVRDKGFREGDIIKFHLIKNGSMPVMKVTGNFNSSICTCFFNEC